MTVSAGRTSLSNCMRRVVAVSGVIFVCAAGVCQGSLMVPPTTSEFCALNLGFSDISQKHANSDAGRSAWTESHSDLGGTVAHNGSGSSSLPVAHGGWGPFFVGESDFPFGHMPDVLYSILRTFSLLRPPQATGCTW